MLLFLSQSHCETLKPRAKLLLLPQPQASFSMAAATPLPSGGAIPKDVERGVEALLKWRASKSQTQKPQLLENDEFVYLVLTLKKIPQLQQSRINPYRIPLPHPLFNPPHDNTELCLFIDDRPKSGLNKEAAAKKVEEDGIPMSKIIKLSKLRTDYRPFEAKRKLCESYDMFLADKRVIPLLPKMIGKEFFKKKKIPVGVDLNHNNWKEQIEKACGSALLFLRSGTCSVVKVGRVSMEREAIVENVVAAINGIADTVPRKWSGIRSFHLKLLESLALPVYQAVPDLTLKIGVPKAKECDDSNKNLEKEKASDSKKKQKGRMQEVRYMDVSFIDEDVLGNDDGEEGDAEDDNGIAALVGKKRKSGAKVKPEKRVKKLGRVKSLTDEHASKKKVGKKNKRVVESEEANRKKKKSVPAE